MSHRSMTSAKNSATWFESLIAGYLARWVDDRIERRRLAGSKDRGDISGLRFLGQRVVIECKEYGGSVKCGPWLNETETERCNDDAGVGIVIAKRLGTRNPGDQIVIMTVRDLVSLIMGERPSDGSNEAA